ncbi:ATPase [Pedobacter kyungheensis]|uniref:ATPase n=1 Tax=Pedobacter kyungheensis TaxID=1069985 RepID=A0A0C1DE01_9SPHI|nr:SRPBCC domain-containing protein [Pedobacter kyungheensis]KIA95891.1 ATPase [Pedobacter kyungheensis]
MENEPVIVERVYNAPIGKVWKSLTDNNEIKQWYFQLADFKPEVGFKFEFTGGPDDGPQYLHVCEITEIVEGKKLAYTWRYDGYPGNSVVSWELFEQGDKTLLKLTHTGLESFANNGSDFAKTSFNGGWNYFVNDALKNYLEPAA